MPDADAEQSNAYLCTTIVISAPIRLVTMQPPPIKSLVTAWERSATSTETPGGRSSEISTA